MSNLVLSLFPGIGLLDRAFHLEGWQTVRGSDPIWGGDIREDHYPPGVFTGVIGGPPCQEFSRLSHMVRQNGFKPKFGNLIPEFERCVRESDPLWFLMENVVDAPRPKIDGWENHELTMNLRWLMDDSGEPCKVNRLRAFTFGMRSKPRGPGRTVLMIETACLEHREYEYAATGGSSRPVASGSGKPKRFRDGKSRLPWNAKSKDAVHELVRKQGLPDGFTDHLPFTVEAACKALGNGVPIPMGRAIARAIREAVAG